MRLYPQRQRCVSCRSYFDFIVLAGQWCSYECAGREPPSANAKAWPRQHFHWGNRWVRMKKTCYLSQESAELAALGSPGMKSYLCPYCLLWHNGHVDENSTSKVD